MNHEDNIKRLLHVTNEWADMATNGLQWLRNIVEGISDPKAALENMEVCAKHCRAVNDAAVDAMALGEPATDEQIEDMLGEANRGFCIERDDYFKAFRDAEKAHGIGAQAAQDTPTRQEFLAEAIRKGASPQTANNVADAMSLEPETAATGEVLTDAEIDEACSTIFNADFPKQKDYDRAIARAVLEKLK